MKPKMPKLKSPTPWRLTSRPSVTPWARPSRLATSDAGYATAEQEGAEVAMHRRNDVVRRQRIARADADRLVPTLAECAAHPSTLLPVREHAVVEEARVRRIQ